MKKNDAYGVGRGIHRTTSYCSCFRFTVLSCSSRNDTQNTNNIQGCGRIETLYAGEEAKGFDLSNGGEWIYPTNYPVRKYQKNIVSNALFKNTLVCLPTGLGKTFIAAVVMYNYHRWYPKHIIVFMAHSKPLVTQQVNACCNIMGISPSLIAELNGNMLHSNRKKHWETKKIFFLTPQVFNNDLARGNVKAESIRCLVIDEAHKALGNQAYCQVIRSIRPFNSNFRVLALSATPGDDMNMVKEVIQNLMISHLELRNEEDPDIKPYLHEKKVETIVVKLDDKILDVKDRFYRAVDKYVQPLMKHKLLPPSFSSINRYSLVLKQRQFIQNPNTPPTLRGIMLSNFSVSISLFHAVEELGIYGLRSFITKLKCLQSGEGSTNKSHYRLANDEDIKSLIQYVDGILGPDRNISFDGNKSLTRIFDDIDSITVGSEIVYSHPKFVALEKIIQDHFQTHQGSTKAIVFCKSRQCTGEICNFLARLKPLVKPMVFIGQSQSSGIVAKGFNQATQLTVMKKFRDGVYNTLVATCVAEEGLDIGEVDLIVNFDSGKNSNTQVQRSGRTGRKRDGRVVNLVTEGKEEHNYNLSVYKGKKINKRLVSDATKLPFYAESPRLIPKALNPVCQEMFFSVKKVAEEEPQEQKRKGKATAKKKLQDTSLEENRVIKKVKECNGDTENGCGLWSMVADKKCGNSNEAQVDPRPGSSVIRNVCEVLMSNDGFRRKAKGRTKNKKLPCRTSAADKEIEIIDLEPVENPTAKFLHYDDVRVCMKWDGVLDTLEEVEVEEEKAEGEQATNDETWEGPAVHDALRGENSVNDEAMDGEALSDSVEGEKATESGVELAERDKEEVKIRTIGKEEVLKLFKRCHSLMKPKFRLKELINVRNLRKYPSTNNNNADLTRRMKSLENCTLNDFGMDCLLDENLKTDYLVTYLEELRYKMHVDRDATSKMKETTDRRPENVEKEKETPMKSSTSEEMKMADEIDPNDFLLPMEDFQLSRPNVASSTPVRRITNAECNIEKSATRPSDTRKTPEPFPFGDQNFQNWDEDDFYLQDNFSPKREVSGVNQRGSSGKKDKGDGSLISITQAIDLVNAKTSDSVHPEVEEEKASRPVSPSSPILFFSQKSRPSRTQRLCEPASPILTQKVGGKRSRKYLNFKQVQQVNCGSPVLGKIAPPAEKFPFGNEDGDSSDLFVETEIALHQHLEELEANLGKMEKVGENSKEEGKAQPAPVGTAISDENTQEYDLGDVNFDENGTLDSILKMEGKSKEASGKTSEVIDSKAGAHSEKRDNGRGLGVSKPKEDNGKSVVETTNLSRLSFNDFSSFFNSETKNKTPTCTPIKAESKMAVVRPLGFGNPIKRSSAIGCAQEKKRQQSERKKTPREDEQISFACNFSLFGDDDFGDIGVGSEQTNKVEGKEKERKDEGSVVVDQKVARKETENVKEVGCFGDDDELSDDSDLFVNKESRHGRSFHREESKNGLEREVEEFKNMAEDGDLSDGAMEAIKAVEMYEKDAKLADKMRLGESTNLVDIESDDSEDFFLPTKRQEKNRSGGELSKTSESRTEHSNKKRTKVPAAAFIDAEAELSDHGRAVSSDEENTSGLDEYDSSFVDEREVLTQAQGVDITAKYLQSTKSPMAVRPGTFKIPQRKVVQELNVFSQIGSEGESDYENDSFCVSEEENTEVHEISELELAEMILQYKKKRKRKEEDSTMKVPEKKRKEFRRVLRIESDSDEDEEKVPPKPKIPVKSDTTNDSSDLLELFNSPFPMETDTSTSSKTTTTTTTTTAATSSSSSAKSDLNCKPVIFVASRQIAGAPEITTCLRAKWNVNVHVRSAPEADYIVSWRVGVNRLQLSDFASGSASAKNSLKEIVQNLLSNFHEPVLIVEDDKNKGLPLTVGCQKFMWTRQSARNVVKVLQNDIKIIFSRSKDETARLLVRLWNAEREKGYHINVTSEIDGDTERKMKFYCTLPGMNVANAFRMTTKFSSVTSFLRCCDSVPHLIREMGLKKAAAVKVYQTMFTAPSY